MSRNVNAVYDEVVLTAHQVEFLVERSPVAAAVLVIGSNGLVVAAACQDTRIPPPRTAVPYGDVVRAVDPSSLHQVYRAMSVHGRGAIRGSFEVGGAFGRALLEVDRNDANGTLVLVFSDWEPMVEAAAPLEAISADAAVVAVAFEEHDGPGDHAAAVAGALRADPRVLHLRSDDSTFVHASVDVASAADVRTVLEDALGPVDDARLVLRAAATERGWPSGPTATVAAVGGLDHVPLDRWFITVPSPMITPPDVRDLEGEFEVAVRSDQLTFLVQPVLDIDEDRIVGGELLARWTDSTGAAQSPPMGSLRRHDPELHELIDRIALRAAIPVLASLAAAEAGVRLHVNVSDDSLRAGSELLGEVAAELVRRGLDPSRLVVEVMEHAGPGPTADVATLGRVAELGFGLALDDAGAGARLDLLHAVHFDLVKVDASLIAGLPGPRATHIVGGLVAVAQGLGAEVVAEGVETTVQIDALRGRSVSAQGHLVSHPLAPDEFVALVAEGGWQTPS